jgi:hypothetical protein
MTDWNDLSLHICAQYRAIKSEPHWIGAVLTFEAGEVRIKIERVTAFDAPWVLVIAAICSERHVDAPAALRYNARIVAAALVVENQRCYLRAALPLDEISVAALDRAIEFIARESLELRREFAPGLEASTDLFGNFGE